MSVNRVSFGSDNGLSPMPRQAIIGTSAGLLSLEPFGIFASEIWIKTQNFSFTKMHLKISSAKWWPFCPVEFDLTHGYFFSTQTDPEERSVL